MPVLCVLGACFSKPAPFTGDGGSDASFVTKDCGAIPFAGLHELTEFTSVSTGEPTITGGLLELYFTTEVSGMYAIGYAKRSQPTSRFTVMGTVPFEPANVIPPDASVTADGNLLVYRAEQASDRRLYYVTREASGWGAPRLVPGLETIDVTSLDLSGDGLTLYVETGQLEMFRRATRTDAFVLQPPLLGPDFRYPAVTADGLELFYNDGSGGGSAIKRTARTSNMEVFLPGLEVFSGFDPDLSPDGQTLVFSKPNNPGIMMAERTCP